MDDFQLSRTYFDKVVFNELNLNRRYIKNTLTQKLYLVRLWFQWHDKYVYKLGITTNLKRRIKEHNSHYESCGKIIIVFCADIDSSIREKDLHNKLKKYRDIESSQGKFKKYKEIYNISPNFYDKLEKELKKYSTNIFESDDYSIDNESIENFRMENVYKTFFPNKLLKKIENNDFNLHLSNKKDEIDFWNSVRKNY